MFGSVNKGLKRISFIYIDCLRKGVIRFTFNANSGVSVDSNMCSLYHLAGMYISVINKQTDIYLLTSYVNIAQRERERERETKKVRTRGRKMYKQKDR